MSEFNFNITSSAIISQNFAAKEIRTFSDACVYVRNLSYKRNSDKNNLTSVFSDNCGTCSTKHALLKQLAIENNVADIKLMLGIFKMNANNTPQIKTTLEKHGLAFIPEAHNYLKVNGEIIDCTKNNFSASDFENEIISEIEIEPNQITDFKVKYHQNILKEFLLENPDTKLSFAELWAIREQCIEDLSRPYF